jgi:outer membrane protein assembly factor BamD (BamD/ComL family)
VLGNVGDEARLLRRADNALQSGSFTYALQLLDELAARFPNGVLTEERSAERISTLCKLGKTEQARAEAARFLRSTPSSPLAKSVKASCAAPLDASPR